MKPCPFIRVHATFLTQNEGGRQQTPLPCGKPNYRPHIVMQPADVRVAIVEQDRSCREDYLGVELIDGPAELHAGQSAELTFSLMYHPQIDYSAVVPNAEFTIREGSRIIGFGTVISNSALAE